jgi:hypothetical protein
MRFFSQKNSGKPKFSAITRIPNEILNVDQEYEP